MKLTPRELHGGYALMRDVADTLNGCALEFQPAQHIDVERARAQQRELASVLEHLGKKIIWLPGDNTFPDCCYIEDTAVALEDVALITNPGTPARKGEIALIKEWFTEHEYLVECLDSEAFLEGGDVMRVEDTLYIGTSNRTTNQGGVDALRAVCEVKGIKVQAVPVGNALHLKTACTYLGDGVLIAVKDALPSLDEWADGFQVIEISPKDMPVANVVAIGKTTIMSAGWPHIAKRIEAYGFEVIQVDISEHHKAEAGLTCLSILL